MKNTSNLFKDYFNLRPGNTLANKPLNETTIPLNEAVFPLYAGDKSLEYKVSIGSLEYLDNALYSIKIDNALCDGNKFSIGNANSAKLIVSLKIGTETIPKMANVKVYARYNGTLGPAEWVQYGSYYIDERSKKNNKLILTCYDSMLKAEKPFIQDETIPDFPMSQLEALNIICTRLGLTLDSVGINTSYTIDYPNEKSMRQVLMDIACSNGGNFTIVNDTLKLIKPSNAVGETFDYAGFEEINDNLQFSRVTMYYTDELYYTAGNDTKDELVVRNDNATQTICNAVLSQLSGYTHRPFKCKSAYLNPVHELGDVVKINDVNYQIWSCSLTFSAGIKYSIGSPGESAIEHEYPYEGQYSREIKQRVQLNQPYFGVKINRTEGLKIEKSDGSSEAIFNSEIFAMRAKIADVMKDQIYFDNISAKFKISSDVEIEAINTLSETVSSLSLTTEGINTRVGNAEGSISTLNQTVSGFETRVSNVEGSVSTVTQTASNLSIAINNTKVVIDNINGLTIYDGGLHVKDTSNNELLSITSNKISLIGEIFNGTTTTGVKITDGEISFYAANSGWLPSNWGKYTGKMEGWYQEGFGSSVPYIYRIDILGKNSVRLYTESYASTTISYELMAYNSINLYHKFVGSVMFHGKLFNTTKAGNALTSSDYVLVSN